MSRRLPLIGTLAHFLLGQWGRRVERAEMSLSWPKVKEMVLLKCINTDGLLSVWPSVGSMQKLSYNHISDVIWKRENILYVRYSVYTFLFSHVWAITKNIGIKTYNVALGSENLIILVCLRIARKRLLYTKSWTRWNASNVRNCVNEISGN